MPTIDLHISTSHEATRIADHEHCGSAKLFWLTQLAEHVLRGPVPPSLRVLLEQRCGHGCDDVAGRDGVDADAELAPFRSEVLGKLDDACFGGVVGWTDESLEDSCQ